MAHFLFNFFNNSIYTSIVGIIVFITSILGLMLIYLRIIKILKEIRKLELEIAKMTSEEIQKVKLEIGKVRKFRFNIIFWVIFIMVVMSGGLLIGRAITAPTGHEALTAQAWNAYNSKNYKKAIEFADDVIFTYIPTARRMQEELSQEGVQAPPEGKVEEGEKNKIFSLGLLNDVATCLYIKGLSYERISDQGKALRAYRKATFFTYARTYDPSWGGFWSPAQAARDRLSNFER